MKIDATNPRIRNVVEWFDGLPTRYLSDLTVFGSTKVKLNPNSHVQGIVRSGRYLILSHSDARSEEGMFVVTDGKQILDRVRVAHPEPQSPHLNHPGGFQMIGGCLAVPIESIGAKKSSSVMLFDAVGARAIRRLETPAPIDRPCQKAGAVGITSVTIDVNEYWLLAVYDNGKTDWYLSDGRPFLETRFQWLYGCEAMGEGYPSLCLLTDINEQIFAVVPSDGRMQQKIGPVFTRSHPRKTRDENSRKALLHRGDRQRSFQMGRGD